MAYPTRGRDPLLDANTQAFLEQRGRELIGAACIVAAVFLSVMLATYSADDSTFWISDGSEINNWIGRFGASFSSVLLGFFGVSAWALPILCFAWGLRAILHAGLERCVSRLIYAPFFLFAFAIYAATWTQSPTSGLQFPLGGSVGFTGLYILLDVSPSSPSSGANVVALVFGILTLAFGLFTTGVTKRELQFSFLKTCLAVSAVVATIVGAIGAARTHAARDGGSWMPNRDRSEPENPFATQEHERSAELQRVVESIRGNVVGAADQPLVQRAPTFSAPSADPKLASKDVSQTMFGLMPSLLKRDSGAQEPEPSQDASLGRAEVAAVTAAPDDRIGQKIANAIRQKMASPVVAPVAAEPVAPMQRQEPLLIRPTAAQPVAPQGQAAPPVVSRAQSSHPMAPAPMAVLEDAEENIFVDDIPDVAFDQVVSTAVASNPMPPLTATEQPKVIVQSQLRKPIPQSRQAKAEAQPGLQFEQNLTAAFEAPPLSLLSSPEGIERHVLSNEALEANARMLENVLDDYGVKGEIVSVKPGPVVTMYELEPAAGVKASRVIGLADDIARSMSALTARVSTVPGRSVIGIELPNANREMVVLREILSTRDFGDSSMGLPLALGKDIGGEPIVANLAKMPHLLIAGTTGSGKSVAINTMILSLLYRLTPEECRMIMIDPKMLELSVYDGIPHLLSPVVTDPKKAVVALKWVVGEMEERYRKMSKMGVRNIDGYNSRVADALSKNEMFNRTVQTGFDDETGEPVFETEEFAPERLPYIVVVVDEMADLMMVAGKEIEACIQRLAQMARASGIHLIMATQRPSVDVITGTIKANFPTRISFQVTSKVDSRTILGEMGAEQLLGMGDMLYMAGGGKITRVHGPFCSDEEVEEVVNHLKAYGPPTYLSGVVDGPSEAQESNIDAVLGLGGNTDSEDALYDTAVQIVAKDRKCSTSYIQRKLAIGYNKAARLVEQMEDAGLVSPANHVGKREILMPEQS